MDLNSKTIFKTLNPNKVWIPILLGLGIVALLLYFDDTVDPKSIKLVFKAHTGSFILAIFVVLARDVGYIYRIRTISGQELSWVSSIYVIIMWEFASAVTPSIVGGTAVAVFILLKEGITLGRSLAYVMVTAILDNLFFVIMAPLVMLLTQGDIFPYSSVIESKLGKSLPVLFAVSYSLIAVYTFLMAFALLVKPRAFKWLLLKLTSIRFLKKWRKEANEQGNEIILASSQLKGKNASYWFKIILSTIFIWSARYIMLNCLIAAFAGVNFMDHMLIFSRQIIMWIVMLISPTPGSSGTAEFFFNQFFNSFLGEYTIGTNLLWRAMSYYPYLILGALFLPKWIRRVFFKKKESPSSENSSMG